MQDVYQALAIWMKELERYDFTQLLAKPSPTSWSLGQLYIHLIQSTRFFIKQARISSSNNDNSNEDSFAGAKTMFRNNEFPDTLLEDPPSNAVTPQPPSKEKLITELIRLKEEIKEAEALASVSQFSGKTRHFGLGFFTSVEWIQFSEMHLRHHLRQKKRLDDFLKESGIKE